MRDLFEQFFDSGYTQKADLHTFLSQLPVHHFGGFGGNTTCIEIKAENQQILIDAGSGIRSAGYEMMSGACGHGAGEVHLLFTHFHWDHLIGLPFFTPIFVPGNKIHVYAVQPDLKDAFESVFKKPYFPLNLNQLGATLIYHRIEPRVPFKLGNISITPYQLDHPDPCWGFRFEHRGKVFSHCVDTECTRVTREELGPDLPLYQGVDLMIFDAQYTLMESLEKVHWGHAAASLGLEIAIREGVKKVLFMHHDPASSDEKIAAAESQARRYYETQQRQNEKFHPVEWSFAQEGLSVEI